jgi:hypothetical protein
MKTFEEILAESKIELGSISEYITINESEFQYLNESERIEVQEILKQYGDKKISELDEGIIGSIFGGAAGFLAGPAVGKIIANALGIDKGIFYDMLTSRLVGAALGAALSKFMGSKQ